MPCRASTARSTTLNVTGGRRQRRPHAARRGSARGNDSRARPARWVVLTVSGTGPGCAARAVVPYVGPSGQYRIPELIAGPVSASFRTSAGKRTAALCQRDRRGSAQRDDHSESSGGAERQRAGYSGPRGRHARGRIEGPHRDERGRTTDVQTSADGVFLAEGIPVGPITIRVTDAGPKRCRPRDRPEPSWRTIAPRRRRDSAHRNAPRSHLHGAGRRSHRRVPSPEGRSSGSTPRSLALEASACPGGRQGAWASAASLSADRRTVTLTPAGSGWPDSSRADDGGWCPWVTRRVRPSPADSASRPASEQSTSRHRGSWRSRRRRGPSRSIRRRR